jgi:hypothetical protein
MSSKLSILKDISLGQRVAEEEADELQKYFVKTSDWDALASGKVDIVYGPKGSGKSALYTSLLQQDKLPALNGIGVVSAENPRGTTAFKQITIDPPPTEQEFTALWKLYIVVIAAKTIRKMQIDTTEARALLGALEEAKLLPAGDNLSYYFRATQEYVKRWMGRDKASVEHEIEFDALSGLPKLKRKVHYAKKSQISENRYLPVDEYLATADNILKSGKSILWIAFDRLDVAFADSPDLERNALRALFRSYNDMKGRTNICLKIFVRDDIWGRITQGGFTEASHITRSLHIEWVEEDLLNLVVLRLIASSALRDYYKVDGKALRASYDEQVSLFYRIFPDKIATGKNPKTLGWIISRTSDASGKGKPREVIHLIETARLQQITALERGAKPPSEELLIDRASMKAALPLVSKVYFEQTVLAEYPDLKLRLEALHGQKATQTVSSLSKLWGVSQAEALELAKRLTEIGFFEKKGEAEVVYRVPFLLRHALNMVQGQAAD